MTAEYIPSPSERTAQQVEQYESSNGREGTTMRGMPVVIVTMRGRKTGGIRKVPLMRVADGDNYVIVASKGGAPEHPVWYYNLIDDPDVTLRDLDVVTDRRARLVTDPEERARLWAVACEAYSDYEPYQQRTERQIPVFCLERR
ncbi:MAG: nitroreductase family deazaflavin-dependent oxidoreductase [Chloroflexi bacterium]|nr:MAG: nitroreductase family deazaflavin-dependent oxidoreductase [Chloroflexota bacterium]